MLVRIFLLVSDPPAVLSAGILFLYRKNPLQIPVFSCTRIAYICRMTIRDINMETLEGRLLMAALAILTTSDEITILGKVESGIMRTPDEMLNLVCQIAEEMPK